jgi:hypothetical protein
LGGIISTGGFIRIFEICGSTRRGCSGFGFNFFELFLKDSSFFHVLGVVEGPKKTNCCHCSEGNGYRALVNNSKNLIPMKKNTLRTIVFTAIATAISLTGINARAQDSATIAQPEFAKIILQPEDQLVYIGSNATFIVTTENADAYQWLFNGNPINDATNNSFSVLNAQTTDVGFYSCKIFQGTEAIPTRAASLMVYTSSIDPQTGVDPVVVYATPILSSGSSGSCPGSYIGYVAYTKQGSGWSPDTTNGNTIFTATDTNRTNTKVQYLGLYGDNGCNQTSVTIPNPPESPVYEFDIYFTNNVPTNAYAITLNGFNP